MLLVEFEKRFLTLGYSHVGVAHHFGGDVAMTTLDVVVVFFQYYLNVIQVTVQFKDFCRATDSSSRLGIPNFRIYYQFGI